MVLYTEISDQTFLYIFSSRFWSIKSFKTLSECESRIVGCSPNFANSAMLSEMVIQCDAKYNLYFTDRESFLTYLNDTMDGVTRPSFLSASFLLWILLFAGVSSCN